MEEATDSPPSPTPPTHPRTLHLSRADVLHPYADCAGVGAVRVDGRLGGDVDGAQGEAVAAAAEAVVHASGEENRDHD